MSFDTYRQRLLDAASNKVKERCLTKKNCAKLESQKWRQKYMRTQSYKDEYRAKLSRDQTYNYLLSSEGYAEILDYYQLHSETIDQLLASSVLPTNTAVETLEKHKRILTMINIPSVIDSMTQFYQQAIDRLMNILRSTPIKYYQPVSYQPQYIYRVHTLDLRHFPDFIEVFEKNKAFVQLFPSVPSGEQRIREGFVNHVLKRIEKQSANPIGKKRRSALCRNINQIADQYQVVEKISKLFTNKINIYSIVDCIQQNPTYQNQGEQFAETAKKIMNLKDEILKQIPDNYTQLFPEARLMKRKFVLHIGPTNSGKTYEALQCLSQAKSGAYLAPLRLLAYEQFDKMNKAGIPCDLLTGEESIQIPNAKHISSTIEMADLNCHYDVVVIDEAQLISDKDRGHSWTKAILGILADEIHICAAPHAQQLLEKLIKKCDDVYTVHKTHRQVPLVRDSNNHFVFPKDVQPHDALIVFSRKQVHAVASELQANGIKCSMIYGNLPYDVRYNEARKFYEGVTDVVVSTDAIGMGLNMPIKRVVFLQTEKFDGTVRRALKPEEVQQIVGRAGRFGIYDVGTYNTIGDLQQLEKDVQAEVPPLTHASIDFVPSLLDLDVDLSFILRKWNELTEKRGFKKADISIEIDLCQRLEVMTKDKKLIYELITIPFNENNSAIYSKWLTMSRKVINGQATQLSDMKLIYSEASSLSELELTYQLCDLYYAFCRKFWHTPEMIEYTLYHKAHISHLLIAKLDQQAAERRICKICGRPLPWNAKYNTCPECYFL